VNWWQRPVWAFDVETTGADPHTCQIVEWALLKVAPSGRIVEMHGGVANVEIPPEASAVHGIDRATAKWGGQYKAVASHVSALLNRVAAERLPVVAFNAAYDLTIVANSPAAHPYSVYSDRLRVIDPLVIDRHCDKHRRGKRRLADVCKQYGLELTGWHSALSDALAAAHLAYRIAEEHHELRSLSLDELHAAQVAWAAEWADGLQNFKRRNGEPTAVVDGSWPVKREGVTT
jgi:DNA polymerase-3 subunit epsilon